MGLYPKYTVTRNDNRGTYANDPHFVCKYFVLDLTHDHAARAAAVQYAFMTGNYLLARDLLAQIRKIEGKDEKPDIKKEEWN